MVIKTQMQVDSVKKDLEYWISAAIRRYGDAYPSMRTNPQLTTILIWTMQANCSVPKELLQSLADDAKGKELVKTQSVDRVMRYMRAHGQICTTLGEKVEAAKMDYMHKVVYKVRQDEDVIILRSHDIPMPGDFPHNTKQTTLGVQ